MPPSHTGAYIHLTGDSCSILHAYNHTVRSWRLRPLATDWVYWRNCQQVPCNSCPGGKLQHTGLTQDNLSVEVVDKQAHELRFDGQLVSQHAQVVAEVGVLRDDHAQAAALVLRPPSAPEDLLHIQHPWRSTETLSVSNTPAK